MHHNPYAPPRARLSTRTPAMNESQAWREGDLAVLAPLGQLPPHCIRCAADAEQPIKERTVYWHTPWLYLLILISPLIYLIVALIARKRARVSPGLCSEHRTQRHHVVVGCLLASLAGIGLLVSGISASNSGIGLLGGFTLLAAIIFFLVKGRLVYATRIDANRIELKGCSEAFLASLPRRR
ncbi:MAG: hypothetical protein JNN30_04460 [Rhodanobacteraceae bacterium]|nr:hypothetical protein [Rhodanobacteraceae bacterium]